MMTDPAPGIRAPEPVDVKKVDADDAQLWSVTTLIGALDKPALMYWAAEQSSIAAVNNLATVDAMMKDEGDKCAHVDADTCTVIKWLRDARFRRPPGERSAAELGTEVHAACEEYAITGTRPDVDDEVEPFLVQFERWCERNQPEYQAAEVTVYNPTYSYAGTADAFFTVAGTRFIVDYKSSRKSVDGRGNTRKPYAEQVGLQLAAYANAEFAAAWRPRRYERFRRRYYLLSETERVNASPVPPVDMGMVLQITPEFCHAYPIDVGPETYTAFLYVIESFRWVNETSRLVMAADPLETP